VTKATPQDIKDLGFVTEEFGSPADFTAYIQAVLDEQEALLSDRVGAAAMSVSSLATNIKRAEKCLAAAELLQLRINRLAGNVDSDTAGLISQLGKSRQNYLDEAEKIIPRLVAGSVSDGTDATFGSTVSSHFDSDAAP
jgi:hypothetical protein